MPGMLLDGPPCARVHYHQISDLHLKIFKIRRAGLFWPEAINHAQINDHSGHIREIRA